MEYYMRKQESVTDRGACIYMNGSCVCMDERLYQHGWRLRLHRMLNEKARESS